MSFSRRAYHSVLKTEDVAKLADRTPDWSRAVKLNDALLANTKIEVRQNVIIFKYQGPITTQFAKGSRLHWYRVNKPMQLLVPGCIYIGPTKTSAVHVSTLQTQILQRVETWVSGGGLTKTLNVYTVAAPVSAYTERVLVTNADGAVQLGCSLNLPTPPNGSTAPAIIADVAAFDIGLTSESGMCSPIIKSGYYVYIGEDRQAMVRTIPTASASPPLDVIPSTASYLADYEHMCAYNDIYFVPAMSSPGVLLADMVTFASDYHLYNSLWSVLPTVQTLECIV